MHQTPGVQTELTLKVALYYNTTLEGNLLLSSLYVIRRSILHARDLQSNLTGRSDKKARHSFRSIKRRR